MPDETRQDGGPAFPQSEAWGSKYPVPEGMSLRDYFAGRVLEEALERYEPRQAAAWAYRVADAMLEARDAR
jgi:hypothetical protein